MDKPPVPSERENGLAETVPNREKPEQMPQVLVAFSKVFRLLKKPQRDELLTTKKSSFFDNSLPKKAF
ncbi:MAG: hypothetical protein ABFC75_08160 [Rectinema sp.]